MKRTKADLEKIIAEHKAADEVIEEFVVAFDVRYDKKVEECMDLKNKVNGFERTLDNKNVTIEKLIAENRICREQLKLKPKPIAEYYPEDMRYFGPPYYRRN